MNTLWIDMFLITLFIEVITVNLVTIWFSIGSLFALAASFFTDSLLVQFIVFVVSSTISLLITKPLVNKIKIKNIVPTNSDRYIGKVGEVIESIEPLKNGKVKVLGSIWTACSETPIEVGTKVMVNSIEGVKLVVSKKED